MKRKLLTALLLIIFLFTIGCKKKELSRLTIVCGDYNVTYWKRQIKDYHVVGKNVTIEFYDNTMIEYKGVESIVYEWDVRG